MAKATLGVTIVEEMQAEEFSTAMQTFRDRVQHAVEALHVSPREVYVEGGRYQVRSSIARLEGIRLFGDKHWAGWSRPLVMGEVLICDGWKPCMDTDAEGVNWRGPRIPDDLLWCQVWPIQGLFTPWPMDGIMKRMPD